MLTARLRIRVTKTPPAPLMDGFDLANLLAGGFYDVDGRTANYLVIAGYAVRVRANDDHAHDLNRTGPRDRRHDRRLSEDRIREEHHDANARTIPPHGSGHDEASN